MSAHTPGPWSAPRNGLDGAVYAENAPKGQLWRITDRVHGLSDEELAANAMLIAAAPDLLAALQEIVRYHEDGDFAQRLDEQAERATAGNCTALDGLLSLASVAIAKATQP